MTNSNDDDNDDDDSDNNNNKLNEMKLEMWANARRDGRLAEYRWRPLFNAAKFC